MDVFRPTECYRKYYVMEQFEPKECRCFMKCKYNPPKKLVPIKIATQKEKTFINKTFFVKKKYNE